MRLRTLGIAQLTTPDSPILGAAEACAAITKLAEEGAEVIFTPETTHVLTEGGRASLDAASYEQDDEALRCFCGLARALGLWLHIGSMIIKVAEDRLVNRQFVISSEGDIISRYDKLHLFDVDLGDGERYQESRIYGPGNHLMVTDVDMMSVGSSICFDVRFPAIYQRLAEAGAEVIAVPAAFTQPTGEAHWHSLLRARAIETGSYVVAAAQCGTHASGRKTYGHSLVVDPWGKVLLDAGDAPGIHIVHIDLDKVAKARRQIPALALARSLDAVPTLRA